MLYCRHGKSIEPKAALPLLFFSEGSSSPPDIMPYGHERKEGETMYVTYQDLIQIGIRIVALANLFYQIYKGRLFDRLRFIKSGCYFLDLCVY